MLKFLNTKFDGLSVVEKNPFIDERGTFSRLYCSKLLKVNAFPFEVQQINFSSTIEKATIRGMHYQEKPFEEAKLVTCLKGEIFDVVVDIRKSSPTYGQSFSIVLSDENLKSILIPPGFAHGFQTMKDNCNVLYLHSLPHNKESERGLNPFDPSLDINWPLSVSKISDKDKNYPLI